MTLAHIHIKHWDGRLEQRSLPIGTYVIGRDSGKHPHELSPLLAARLQAGGQPPNLTEHE